MIRVQLPAHLRTLAEVDGEISVRAEAGTIGSLLDELERQYPVLQGTIRDHGTLRRRPFVRFFACEQDLSFSPAEEQLPAAITSGREAFLIIGAMAGG